MEILHPDTRLLLKHICCMLSSKENQYYLVYFWFMVNEEKNAVREDGTVVLTIQC